MINASAGGRYANRTCVVAEGTAATGDGEHSIEGVITANSDFIVRVIASVRGVPTSGC